MMILKLIIYLVVAYGITQIIVESVLFKPIRALVNRPITRPIYSLITCFICTGAWVGFLLSTYWYSPINNIFEYRAYIHEDDITFFLDGMLTSALVWEFRLIESVLNSFKNRLINDAANT